MLLVVALGALVWWSLNRAISVNADNSNVFIPENTTVVAAIDTVSMHCNLSTPWLVSTVARAMSRIGNKSIQSGWYEFATGDTQLEVLQNLFEGHRRPSVRLTIPEGLTYHEIASLVAEVVETDSAGFVEWCENEDVIEEWAPGAPSMEGYLMPNTYQVFWRTSGADVAKRLAKEWRLFHTDSIPTHEELTLASIIQAEAVVSYEMPAIAGVYKNRLRVGMKLSADPTVQYGLGEKRRLLYKDLENDDPYNTYRNAGLPPGPINNPGMLSVVASRHPDDNDFYYFCAKGDGSGEHRFAKTGVEHQANVVLYRRARNSREN